MRKPKSQPTSKPYVPRDTPKTGKTLFDVGRRLTDAEWSELKAWRRANPTLAWRSGAPNPGDPSIVFHQYNRDSKNGERWSPLPLHELAAKQRRENYHKHRDEYRARSVVWSKANRERRNAYGRHRYHRNPLVSKIVKMRYALWRCIASQKGCYAGWLRISKQLGCGFGELYTHIESQFEPGMTWRNYGGSNPRTKDAKPEVTRREVHEFEGEGWEIDHIVPLSTAKTEEEIDALFHHTNLRPLWRSANREKGTGLANIPTRIPQP